MKLSITLSFVIAALFALSIGDSAQALEGGLTGKVNYYSNRTRSCKNGDKIITQPFQGSVSALNGRVLEVTALVAALDQSSAGAGMILENLDRTNPNGLQSVLPIKFQSDALKSSQLSMFFSLPFYMNQTTAGKKAQLHRLGGWANSHVRISFLTWDSCNNYQYYTLPSPVFLSGEPPLESNAPIVTMTQGNYSPNDRCGYFRVSDEALGSVRTFFRTLANPEVEVESISNFDGSMVETWNENSPVMSLPNTTSTFGFYPNRSIGMFSKEMQSFRILAVDAAGNVTNQVFNCAP